MTQNDDRNRERERGTAAVIIALLLPVLFGSLALALDFGKLVYERHHLTNSLDAAALAGAGSLPNDPAAAKSNALKFAVENDPEAAPIISFWCIVASNGAAKTVEGGQIPSVCNPGSTAGAKCNETICAIPCNPSGAVTCNTITVTDDKDVPFNFAPVIGFDRGNTGAIAANACRGSCGSQIPNPMNIALVADRTGSMTKGDRDQMVAGINSTLQTMTKEQQYVALGTIHRSVATPPLGTCVTEPSGSATSGKWIPIPFSNDYTGLPASPGAKPPLNGSSTLIKGLGCLKASSQGTYLASPMKAAARYVLGLDHNTDLASLPVRSHPARNAIIFETDGQPQETNITTGTTDLSSADDIGTANGKQACQNLVDVATKAKREGILIVTVAFGEANSAKCGTGDYVRKTLAAAASDDSLGNPSDADNDCGSVTNRNIENSDGDFFFCAASGTEMGPIFVSAVNAISSNSRLVRIPGS
jgi:hypothetical protein